MHVSDTKCLFSVKDYTLNAELACATEHTSVITMPFILDLEVRSTLVLAHVIA